MALINGTSGNDVLSGSSDDDQIYGFDGIDWLYGGDGNDYLNPGDNTLYDSIIAGAGKDEIDFSDATSATSFYIIDHPDLSAGITATINGANNTGTIDKGVNGTTTLINIANALNAGYGIRVYGTEFDDVFNVTPGNNGSMRISTSDGDDSIIIGAGNGEMILEFWDGTMGAEVDLATGIVRNDGFGSTDTITGPGNVTWLRASNFDDTIAGSANNERFVLGRGTDTLDAGGGVDTLDYSYVLKGGVISALDVDLAAGTATGASNGVAFVHTISGVERVLGSASDDILRGVNARKDVLEGKGGDDTLIGQGGRDTLKGGDGSDVLTGGNGRDKLIGGKGSDTLNGGNGNDKMTGSGGRDTFIFSRGEDVITDFDAFSNREKIDLSGVTVITGFNNLKKFFLNDVGGDAVIDDGAGNTLTLTGIDIGDLGKGDFIF